jgi:hypothetical protein
MTKTLDQFMPWVMPMVPGCPDPLAQQAIRAAAIDFCVRTDIIQRVITADATINVEDYTITPPSDMQLARILSVSWQGRVLTPVSPDLVTQDVVLRGANVGTATVVSEDPLYFFQKMPNDPGFSLYPIPKATLTLGLTVKASFSPTNAATTVDDPLWDDWVDDIGAGAIAQLMTMPGQPFSSSNARTYALAFRDAVTRAKRVKNEGYLAGSLRVQPVTFAI